MSLFWILLVGALVLFILGFVTVAKWLLIIALVLVLVGLFSGYRAGWGRRRGGVI